MHRRLKYVLATLAVASILVASGLLYGLNLGERIIVSNSSVVVTPSRPELRDQLFLSPGPGNNITIKFELSDTVNETLLIDCHDTPALDFCGSCNYYSYWQTIVAIQVIPGYYDQGNLSRARPLAISPVTYGCTGIRTGTFTGTGTYFTTDYRKFTVGEPVTKTLNVGGYGFGNGYVEFPIGVYTVVGGDIWGGLAILHFTVKGPGLFGLS